MIEFERPPAIHTILDITPLIDVVFQLLLFFLLTSVFIQPGLSVDLPQAASAAFPEEQTGVVVSISRFGDIAVNDRTVPLSELGSTLSEAFVQSSGAPVTIQADQEVAFGLFVHVLDTAKAAGGENLIIAAEFPRTEFPPTEFSPKE